MIKVSADSTIYIACPAHYATGGTELLHQLANSLNSLGFRARIFYFNYKDKNPVNPRFEQYQVPYEKEIIDLAKNILIVSETKTNFLAKFKSIKKVIWWLSIDFYFDSRDEKIFWFIRKKVHPIKDIAAMSEKYGANHHLVQSYYAFDFLKKNGIESAFLSDYLNRKYLEDAATVSVSGRTDQILYNPKKGFEFTKKLIAAAPELKWIPLENLTVAQVADLLKSSKVYIDFGNHPGKDRFPREAAAMGCVVITNRTGAAAFHQDVPIPDQYKFSNESVDEIIRKIKDCISNFEKYTNDFKTYREMILNEEKQFLEQVKSIFVR